MIRVSKVCEAIRNTFHLYFIQNINGISQVNSWSAPYPKAFPKVIYPSRNNSTAIKISGGEISLKNVAISGFGKAVDADESSFINAKKLDISDCNSGLNIRDTENKKDKLKMGLEIDNCSFKKVKTVIRAPKSYDIKAKRSKFEKIETVFDIYVSQEDLRAIGLPEDTPQELIHELLERVKLEPTDEGKVKVMSSSGLMNWLGVASNMVTIATPLVQALISYSSNY